MRKLVIDIFRSDETEYKPLVTIESAHIDCTTNVTYLLDVVQPTYKHAPRHSFCIPAVIDHWLIADGTITIFYKSGFRMEIRRVND